MQGSTKVTHREGMLVEKSCCQELQPMVACHIRNDCTSAKQYVQDGEQVALRAKMSAAGPIVTGAQTTDAVSPLVKCLEGYVK